MNIVQCISNPCCSVLVDISGEIVIPSDDEWDSGFTAPSQSPCRQILLVHVSRILTFYNDFPAYVIIGMLQIYKTGFNVLSAMSNPRAAR